MITNAIKKMITVILSIIICIGLFGVGSVNCAAASDTSYYYYLEDYIFKDDSFKYIYDLETPYRYYVEELDNDAKFQASVALWRIGTLDIEGSFEDITETKQFKQYVAVLIDILTNNINTDNSAESFKEYFDIMNTSVAKKYNKLVIADLEAALEKGATEKVKELLKSAECFNESIELLDKAGDWISYISDGVDLINKCVKMQYIIDLNQNYHNVLDIMYRNCDNDYLAAAINYVSTLCSGKLSDDAVILILSGQYAAEELVGESWKLVKKTVIGKLGLVGMTADLVSSVEKIIANQMFGTGDAISDYYRLKAFYEIDDLVKIALNKCNGDDFGAAYSLFQEVKLMSFDYSKKFIQPLYTGLWGQLFGAKKQYDEYSAKLDRLKCEVDLLFFLINSSAYYDYVENNNLLETLPALKPDISEEELEEQVVSVVQNVNYLSGGNNGRDITLYEDIETFDDYYITGGTIDLNGHTLVVNGDLKHTGGRIYVNGGKLIIKGSYNAYGTLYKNENKDCYPSGYLDMQNESDVVEIKKDWKFYICNDTYTDYNNNTSLQKGTIMLDGNFECLGGWIYIGVWVGVAPMDISFDCHSKIIFNGQDSQTITSENNNLYFYNADFINTNVEILNTNVNLNLNKDAKIAKVLNSEFTVDMNGNNLIINSDFEHRGGYINIQGGKLTVNGDLIQYGEEYYEDGSFKNYSEGGYLNMQNPTDYVKINGDWIANTSYYRKDTSYRRLKCGKIELGGNLKDLNNHYSFYTAPDLEFVFNGIDVQSIETECGATFENVKFESGKIKLDEKNYDFALKNDVELIGEAFDCDIDLNGHTLIVNGDMNHIDGSIKFTGGQLIVNGDLNQYSKNYYEDGSFKDYGCGGYLNMQNPTDYVRITGNWTSNNENHSSYYGNLKCGKIELGGNLKSLYEYRGFYTYPDLEFVFNGIDVQSIETECGATFENVKFESGKIKLDEENYDFALKNDVELIGEAFDCDIDLNGHTLIVNGDMNHIDGSINFTGGKLIVNGDLNQYSNYYYEDGSFKNYGSGGYLNMQSPTDYVKITGNWMSYIDYYAADCLDAGIIELGGDLKSLNSFSTGIKLDLIFNGTIIQSIETEDSVSFGNVKFKNSKIYTKLPGKITWHEHDFEWLTDDNYHWYDCEECGENSGKADHIFEDGDSCTICGYVKEAHTVHTADKSRWFSDETNHWHKCIDCEEKLDIAVHTSSGAATETTDETCAACGYVITPATGHITHTADTSKWLSDGTKHWHKCIGCDEKLDIAVHISSGAATEDTAEICNVCGYVITPETGHIHKNHLMYVPKVSEGCTTNGMDEHYKCSCGRYFLDENAEMEITAEELVIDSHHKWNGTWSSDNDNNHYIICTACGEKKDITAHSYNNGVITTPPTEQTTGIKTYTCSVCKHTKLETIPKLGHTHSPVEGYSSNETGHWYACSECNEKVDFEKHFEDGGTVTKAPTATTSGVRTYKCIKCEYVIRTEIIPAIGLPDIPANPVIPNRPTTPTTSTTPTTPAEPEIKGESGKSGWASIEEELKDIEEGDKVVIYMNGTAELPKDILEAIEGKDIDIVLEMGNGIIWTINGEDIENPETIDLSVSNISKMPAKVINKVTGEKNYVTLSLKHNGDFGFKAVLTIDLGKKNKNLYANLYYYNEKTKKTEFVGSCKIDKNGGADFLFTYASDYIIIIDKSSHAKPQPKATSTTNSVRLSWKAVPGAEKYAVYKYVNGKAVKVKETEKLGFKFNKLKPGKKYSYIVRAYVDGKWTKMNKSDIVSIVTKKK